MAKVPENDSVPVLIPDPEVARRYGVSLMSLFRWSRDPDLSFPAAVQIRSRNYRRADELAEFDRRQIERATKPRNRKPAAAAARTGGQAA